MMDLILSYAANDARVRVVGMEGSRTNPHAVRDAFQDYDITYIVTDMPSFKADDGWLDVFGRRLITQKPEAMELFPPELGNWFSYLMLFEDGARIDLTLCPLEELELYLRGDGLLKILLDKDGRVRNPPEPDDRGYHVQKPSAAFFDDCCNDYWYVSTYVARGLCRGELLFAAEHLNSLMRPGLLRMISWKVGIETNFSLSVGKSYKYLDQFISEELWRSLLSTFRMGSSLEMWESMMGCHALFRRASRYVSQSLGYPYPDYDEKVTAYIQALRVACPLRDHARPVP